MPFNFILVKVHLSNSPFACVKSVVVFFLRPHPLACLSPLPPPHLLETLSIAKPAPLLEQPRLPLIGHLASGPLQHFLIWSKNEKFAS